MIAIRHSSGWSTLINISFFMRSLFRSGTVGSGPVFGWGIRVPHRSGSELLSPGRADREAWSASSSSSGRAEPSADTFKRNWSSPSTVSSAAITSGRKSKIDSRLGLRRVKGQVVLESNELRLACAVYPVLIKNWNAVLDRLWPRRRRVDRQRAGIEPVKAGRSNQLQPADQIGGFERFNEFEVHDLASTLDSQPQGQGEGDLWSGVEALSQCDRDSRAAQHSLQAAHDVAMADQAEIAALGESESHFGGFCHNPRTRTPH